MKSRRRTGLTLFEVVISLAIFIGAVVALWNLSNAAANRASQTQLQTQASLMCQSKLAEAMVGLQELGSVDWQPISDVDNFFWKMDASQNGVDGLYLVQVSVKHEINGVKNAECSLTQYALSPHNRGSTLDQPANSTTPSTPMQPSQDPAAADSGAGGATGGGGTGGGTTGGGNTGVGNPAGGTGGGTTGGNRSGNSGGTTGGGAKTGGGTTGKGGG